MRGKVFNFATAVSMVMLVAAVALWIESYREIDIFTYRPYHIYRAASGGGTLSLQFLQLMQRERNVSTSARQPYIVPLTEFTETTIGYEESEYAGLRRRFPLDGHSWTGRRADWRTTTKSLDLWRFMWVQNSQWPRVLRVSTTIRDDVGLGFTKSGMAVQTQREEQAFGHVLWLPYWFVIMLTAVLPVIRIRRTLRVRRRKRGGMCVSCGYSLTGNTSGVCPECGTTVPKVAADKSPRPA